MDFARQASLSGDADLGQSTEYVTMVWYVQVATGPTEMMAASRLSGAESRKNMGMTADVVCALVRAQASRTTRAAWANGIGATMMRSLVRTTFLILALCAGDERIVEMERDQVYIESSCCVDGVRQVNLSFTRDCFQQQQLSCG
jgi:hypothetical protein